MTDAAFEMLSNAHPLIGQFDDMATLVSRVP